MMCAMSRPAAVVAAGGRILNNLLQILDLLAVGLGPAEAKPKQSLALPATS